MKSSMGNPYKHEPVQHCNSALAIEGPRTFVLLWRAGTNWFSYSFSGTCKDQAVQHILYLPKGTNIYISLSLPEEKVITICKTIDALGKKYGIEQPYYAPLEVTAYGKTYRRYLVRINSGWRKNTIMTHVVLSALRVVVNQKTINDIDPIELLCSKDKYCKRLKPTEREKLFSNLPDLKTISYFGSYGVQEWIGRERYGY